MYNSTVCGIISIKTINIFKLSLLSAQTGRRYTSALRVQWRTVIINIWSGQNEVFYSLGVCVCANNFENGTVIELSHAMVDSIQCRWVRTDLFTKVLNESELSQLNYTIAATECTYELASHRTAKDGWTGGAQCRVRSKINDQKWLQKPS